MNKAMTADEVWYAYRKQNSTTIENVMKGIRHRSIQKWRAELTSLSNKFVCRQCW